MTEALHRLSLKQACTKYDVPEKTLRQALKAGECKGVNFRGRSGWHVMDEDVQSWLAGLSDASVHVDEVKQP